MHTSQEGRSPSEKSRPPDSPLHAAADPALTRRVPTRVVSLRAAPLTVAPLCKRCPNSWVGHVEERDLPDRSDEPRASCLPTGRQPVQAPGDPPGAGGDFPLQSAADLLSCYSTGPGRPI